MNVIDFHTLWLSISNYFYVLIGLTVIDFVYGTIIALVQKRFAWDKLTGYLTSDVLPILAWLVSAFLAAIPAEFIPGGVAVAVPGVIYATVFLRIFASIMGHIGASNVKTDALRNVGVPPSGEEEYKE